MARALATDPQVLLDEIAGGLTDAETDELITTIRQLRADGIAIVWIEHVLHALPRVIDRLVCLAQGLPLQYTTDTRCSMWTTTSPPWRRS